jgi:nitrogen fixation-related uncharacterized protein
MTLIYIVVFGFVALAGLSAAYALTWAVRTGQLRDFGRGARSIFDDEEPVGVMTDGFPVDEDRR